MNPNVIATDESTKGATACESGVDRLLRTLMYEGYILYPYRPSSLKNRFRWTFGTLLPPTFCLEQANGERSFLAGECLWTGPATARITARLRFLQPVERAAMESGDRWQEAVEREIVCNDVAIAELAAQSFERDFAFDVPKQARDGEQWQPACASGSHEHALAGRLKFHSERLEDDVWRIGIRTDNLTISCARDREAALCDSMAAAFVLLTCDSGEFVSSIDPAPPFQKVCEACRNVGVFPILIGDRRDGSQILFSPIILYDYPQLAPASPGDLCDATEIDELLTLRIQTLTDDEKRRAKTNDSVARAIVKRAEQLSNGEIQSLHGEVRRANFQAGPNDVAVGSKVRLRPKGRADAFDLLLDGRTAVIASVAEDFEGRRYVTVVMDDDPGRDLGLLARPGHRFYFQLNEIELLETDVEGKKES